MRYHFTLPYIQAKARAKVAWEAYEAAFDKDDSSPETSAASAAEYAAFEEFLCFPAVTPSEIREKLRRALDREVYLWSDGAGARIFEALQADLSQQQQHPASPEVGQLVEDWSKIYEEWHCLSDYDDDVSAAIGERRTAAFRRLMSEPCTTPGDFIAKAYVNLIEGIGGTLYGAAKADLSGNIFDIDIATQTDQRDEQEVWHRAAYQDLDDCDVGRNLLAYGLPYFSAEKWMERADAVGLRVYANPDLTGFGYTLAEDDAPVERIRRERQRLRSLLATDGLVRGCKIIDEIEREWPQLILRKSPDEGEKSHGSLPGKAA